MEFQVVGVFPHVAGQKRDVAAVERGGGVGGGDQIQLARRGFHQPCPARAEGADGAGVEGFLEGFKAAPFGVDGFSECAGGAALACGGEAEPVEGVVPGLRGVC